MKFTFLTPYDIKSVDIRIVLFLFDINNEDIAISKLVSQLKLLKVYLNKIMMQLLWAPLLKNCQRYDEIEASLISEVGKIVRFFYFHNPPDVESDDIFSALKRVKRYLRSITKNHMEK